MFKAAVGQSENTDIREAVKEAILQIRKQIGETLPQAGILFCPPDMDPEIVMENIYLCYPDMELIGSTSGGELSSVYGFDEDTVLLMVFATDIGEIKAGLGLDISRNGKKSGGDAAEQAAHKLEKYGGEEKFAVVITDPMNAGVTNLSGGIEEYFQKIFPIVGAASSAHAKGRTTYQFYNGKVYTDSITMLLFSGAFVCSFGISGKLFPIGGKEKITSVNRNIIYGIGNGSALDYFEKYIGKDNDIFMNYCLAIYENDKENYYVRSAPFHNKEDRSVTLNGIVKEGSLIQLGTSDKATCMESCKESLEMALKNYPSMKPEAGLVFSCAGRKMVMGTQIKAEAELVKKYLGDIPFCGFYAYGEIGPMVPEGNSIFHGATFVTLLIGHEN